jgi:branched-chain amino acid transport system permease protein
VVATEILILALFAQSLHLIMGPGGMISFGHAAFFGVGAYAAALLVQHLSAPMLPALAAAPIAAGIVALAVGWFCVRLSGVYLAMLTLAFAQIAWSVAFQWVQVTGGDNGILGVWPADWARERTFFYYGALILCGGSILLIRRIAFARFGYALRAGRDSPRRAYSIGVDVRRHQLLAFALSGAFAGLAGGLFAFFKGSVFPTYLSIPVSVDALVMVLLGGVQTLSGPVLGAAVYQGLRVWMEASDYWRLILGVIIVGIVVIFPQGIVGFGRDLWHRRRGEVLR